MLLLTRVPGLLVGVSGQPHVEEHQEEHQKNCPPLVYKSKSYQVNVFKTYFHVNEESGNCEWAKGKMYEVVRRERQLAFEVWVFSIWDGVVVFPWKRFLLFRNLRRCGRWWRPREGWADCLSAQSPGSKLKKKKNAQYLKIIGCLHLPSGMP